MAKLIVLKLINTIMIGVRGDKLSESDQLTPRLTEAVKRVTEDNCVGWIKHAK